MPPANAAATVDLALASGISYLDTAPHYGIGAAERRIGAALARHPRDQFTLSTKVGRIIDEGARTETFEFSGAAVRSSLDSSLGRLGLAAADIAYVHDPDYAEKAARREAFPVLRALRSDGTVRAIGAGMNQAAMLERFAADPALDIDLVLLAGRYTLLDQGGPGCSTYAGSGGSASSSAASSTAASWPTPGRVPATITTPRRRGWWHGPALALACERHGVPLMAAALQFGWGHPAVVSVLNGAGSPAELAANLDYARTAIPPACWEQFRSDGLLPAGVPVPGEA